VATPVGRAELFKAKAKYITADTAWLVMADPDMLVARLVQRSGNAANDIELPLANLTIEAFADTFAQLAANFAGVPVMLQRFRDGDETLIATDKLTGVAGDPEQELALAIARNTFFDTLAETTQLLQRSVKASLVQTRARRQEINDRVAAFRAQFHDAAFIPYPISIQGSPASREEAIAHRAAAQQLTRFLTQEPALARLTLSGLPRFAERTGIDQVRDPDKLETFFSNETANLILARILLIRFLEDHGFFDEQTPDGMVRRRYLCNGGVQAFQGMRGYFGQGYTRLLEDAYRSGAHVYAAAFDETELDCVIALADAQLSNTFEWAMFRFARYDFTTVRGDILTGIYDRFLDRKQRKEQGEYYTPPSIARYILNRLQLLPEDDILDPACGSGTFLLERYQLAVGEAADMNLATYEEARDCVERLASNDINPFSSILT
jgi:N-6 DNA Methylase